MLQIRPFAYADLAALHRMVHDLARHHGDTASVTPDALLRDITGSAPRARVLLAEAEGAPRGYAALVPLVQLQWGRRGANLHNLYVDPDWRGRGLGRALVRAVRDRVLREGGAYLTVGTHPDNVAAQGFYAAEGFAPTAGGKRFRMEL